LTIFVVDINHRGGTGAIL